MESYSTERKGANMSKKESTVDQVNTSLVTESRLPRSLAVSQKGIKTGGDFAKLMSALMSDLIEGRVTPSIGNATCNAGGKLLKVVEMQYKYGTEGPGQSKVLTLTVEETGS
jgi:hypothetical protein